MLVDNVEIKIRAGKGGSGLASFRREKFLPFGGPDGGDGGKGGDIYFVADGNMEDLSVFKGRNQYKAVNGGRGGPNKMHGINAEDMLIRVPVGTTIYIDEEGKESPISDLQRNGQRVLAAKGGRGGQGNVHFATATRKAPKIFQNGEEGEHFDIILKMSLLVDVCIVGYPNSGKSTLLAALTAAKPEIEDYPFTTRKPVLGVVDDGVDKYIWAEIPAIMNGSSLGKGLGSGQLIHTARAKVLVYLIDISLPDTVEQLNNHKREIMQFDPKLAHKKYVVAVNKIDLDDEADPVSSLIEKLNGEGERVYPISAKERSGLDGLVAGVHRIVKDEKAMISAETQPEVIFRPKPVDQRS